MNYDFSFFYVWKRIDTLLEGLVVSLELTFFAILIGLVLGFIIALMRLNRSALLSAPASAFIEFFRCTPSLVQIVWFYYCAPIVFKLSLSPMATVLLALGLNIAAFNAEAYRAAIQAIPKAHIDAGIALGMSPFQRIRYIIFPQALRMAVPVLMTNGVGIFQQSALVSLVAVADLMYRGRMLAVNTYRPIETLTVVALMYFIIAFSFTQIVKRCEDRLADKLGF
jgi:polar amino acid transport system permease protein